MTRVAASSLARFRRPRERNSGERGNSAADSIRKGGTLKAGSFINQNTFWFLLSMLLIIFFEKKVSCTGPGGASGLQIIDRGGIEGGRKCNRLPPGVQQLVVGATSV